MLSSQFALAVLVVLAVALSGSRAEVRLLATPYLYTTASADPEETEKQVHVAADSESVMLFPSGGVVKASWWVPYANIGDLSALNRVIAMPAGNKVSLEVHGKQGQPDARVRIAIYADVYPTNDWKTD